MQRVLTSGYLLACYTPGNITSVSVLYVSYSYTLFSVFIVRFAAGFCLINVFKVINNVATLQL